VSVMAYIGVEFVNNSNDDSVPKGLHRLFFTSSSRTDTLTTSSVRDLWYACRTHRNWAQPAPRSVEGGVA
jgi:hypothetical protein